MALPFESDDVPELTVINVTTELVVDACVLVSFSSRTCLSPLPTHAVAGTPSPPGSLCWFRARVLNYVSSLAFPRLLCLQVFSRTEIDVFTKFPAVGVPIPWRAEPGPLKVVAVETGAGLVQLNPEEGGVVVARVE